VTREEQIAAFGLVCCWRGMQRRVGCAMMRRIWIWIFRFQSSREEGFRGCWWVSCYDYWSNLVCAIMSAAASERVAFMVASLDLWIFTMKAYYWQPGALLLPTVQTVQVQCTSIVDSRPPGLQALRTRRKQDEVGSISVLHDTVGSASGAVLRPVFKFFQVRVW
jgi:hypothetical protein